MTDKDKKQIKIWLTVIKEVIEKKGKEAAVDFINDLLELHFHGEENNELQSR